MKRILDLLIRLYPEDFRKQHEAGMREVIDQRIQEGGGLTTALNMGWDILRGMGVAHWRMMKTDPAMALANGGVLTWHHHAKAAGIVFTGGWMALLAVFVPMFLLGACVWNPHWGPVMPVILLGLAVIGAKRGLAFIGQKLTPYNRDGHTGLSTHVVGMNIGLVLFAFVSIALAIMGLNEMTSTANSINKEEVALRYLFAPYLVGQEGFHYLLWGTMALMFSGFSASMIRAQELGKSKISHYKATKWGVMGAILAAGLACLVIAGKSVYQGGTLSAAPLLLAGVINLTAPLVARANIKNMVGWYILGSILAPLAFMLGSLMFSLVHIMGEEAHNSSLMMKQHKNQFIIDRDEEKLWGSIETLSESLSYRSSPLLGTKVAAGMTHEQWCVLFHQGLADREKRVCSKLDKKNAWISDSLEARQIKQQWDTLPVVGDILGPKLVGEAGQ